MICTLALVILTRQAVHGKSKLHFLDWNDMYGNRDLDLYAFQFLRVSMGVPKPRLIPEVQHDVFCICTLGTGRYL